MTNPSTTKVAPLQTTLNNAPLILEKKVFEFVPNIIMLGLSPVDYVLRSLSKVQTSDLEQTLLALPFSDAIKLLSYLKRWTTNIEKASSMPVVLGENTGRCSKNDDGKKNDGKDRT